MSDPLISVIIPFYNAEQFLREAIESVLDQTYGNTEIIAVDDASTDRSSEICQAYQDKVTVLQVHRAGACAARNWGLKHARGQFIQYLDADDKLSPEKFERQLNFLLAGNFDSVTCNRVCIDEHSKIIYTPTPLPKRITEEEDPFLVLLKYNWPGRGGLMQTQAPLHRRTVLENIGGFRKMIQFAEDKDLALRLAAADAKIGYMDEYLWQYRIHSPQTRASCIKYSDTVYLETVIDLAYFLMRQPVYHMNRTRSKALALELLKLARTARREGYADAAQQGYHCARRLLTVKSAELSEKI